MFKYIQNVLWAPNRDDGASQSSSPTSPDDTPMRKKPPRMNTNLEAQIHQVLEKYREGMEESIEPDIWIPNPDNLISDPNGSFWTTQRGIAQQKLRLSSKTPTPTFDSESFTDIEFSDVEEIESLTDLDNTDNETQKTGDTDVESADEWAEDLDIGDAPLSLTKRILPPQTPAKGFPKLDTPRSDSEFESIPDNFDTNFSPGAKIIIAKETSKPDDEDDPFADMSDEDFELSESSESKTKNSTPTSSMGHISLESFQKNGTNTTTGDEDSFKIGSSNPFDDDDDPFDAMSDSDDDGPLQTPSKSNQPSKLAPPQSTGMGHISLSDFQTGKSVTDTSSTFASPHQNPFGPGDEIEDEDDPFGGMSDDDQQPEVQKALSKSAKKTSPPKMGHISLSQFKKSNTISNTQGSSSSLSSSGFSDDDDIFRDIKPKSAHSKKRNKKLGGPQLIALKDNRSPAGKKGPMLITPEFAKAQGTVTTAEQNSSMRYNPLSKTWEGEEHILERFEESHANAVEEKPNLIAAGATIQEVQLADGSMARWDPATKQYIFDNEEDDPFGDIDFDEPHSHSDTTTVEENPAFHLDPLLTAQWRQESETHNRQISGWFTRFRQSSPVSSAGVGASSIPPEFTSMNHSAIHNPDPKLVKKYLLSAFVSHCESIV